MTKTAATFAAMLTILVVFYLHAFDMTSFLGFDRTDELPPIVRLILSATALLLGVVFGVFHRLWRERAEQLNVAAVAVGLRSAELWRSLLAAPLVFAGVYEAAQTQPDIVVAFFFAFQTGFFTDSVLQSKLKQDQPH